MGNDVFANGREISCKAADGKSLCAFPDVCFTPPTTPATPPGVPIPYPNTAFAKDTTNGSKTVKISGKEVMLKNKSYFKTSTGDEAGSAPKKGVITSKIKGKAYFTAWSMDVKFEGQNVVRHLDLTTHNHASPPANSPPQVYLDTMAAAPPPTVIELECEEGWNECQKKQMKAKAEKMDALAKTKGGLQTRSTSGLIRKNADSWAAKFARDWDKPAPKGWPAFSDPSEQPQHFYDDCAKTADPLANNMQADHVQEVQLGGNVKGPFLWLDADVNGASGRQIKAARARGVTRPTGFTTKNC